ncbi:4-hydroxy-tetrahydrodipicolinate reductase [Clostridium chauvoei]|uniref:4-hydroxy-tetrahydrodipicolinate reductase n=2 Tax=Clostridium chauvoei TaxID=46867 RepID=S6F075_9CLOT|nr:4-hydroxy-tetrahydrodipicolinate reductase [Clostridium chauvoei]ATD55286.1 4-hydroxy-tetrahydrodipicolinate reductase [Clostridium chauvoei]ATD57041.1 4-hydroxy-tetrahydrodipicolinate reductase [Clostridium chauvoei]MBX7279637.1 4-hydroxy-tetrahydrodipicolinate reductase [Clostridium chauvoei]MBX7282006.1 4-hydroxy-tetrahydrodipicolinate reductase [Clostridium chauvoei]MBX7284405.1 4-hydroxy-tetrahydrodipicolinate reductase [Clostridium chauvoei]
MIKVILNGCSGKMGKVITECAKEFNNLEIIGGIDKYPSNYPYPVFKSVDDLSIDYDVLLDFSRADALKDLLKLTDKTKKPLILCSTGYNEDDLKLIDTKSKSLPLFRSANMSLGINLINSLLRKVTPLLYENYDIEIIEKHHNQKLDSPSGTAILLADTIKDSIIEDTFFINGRYGHKKREKNEIGIHAIRGGSIVGDHDVIFAGTGEVLELNHKAISREVFAIGALKACSYMGYIKEPGLYNMDDVLGL